MPDWGWILIAALAVVAVVAIALAARAAGTRKRSERLKEHFGPEYDRTVGVMGDQQAAESELAARERNRKKLDIVPLSAAAHANYAQHWRMVQTAFVDSPASAVGDADRLVTQVMRERGYPIDDFEQRAADISVDHPSVVQDYRAAHAIYLSQQSGDVGTEVQREALVHYRALFEKLLETDNDTHKEARA
ncbi:MAG: hypothetical protein JST91_25035 [Actinobacteria bacterium]|nr:hypothetical protein [Actinomycetota bacterium]